MLQAREMAERDRAFGLVWEQLQAYGYGRELHDMIEKKIFPYLSEEERHEFAGWVEEFFQYALESFLHGRKQISEEWELVESMARIAEWQAKYPELHQINFQGLFSRLFAEFFAYCQMRFVTHQSRRSTKEAVLRALTEERYLSEQPWNSPGVVLA